MNSKRIIFATMVCLLLIFWGSIFSTPAGATSETEMVSADRNSSESYDNVCVDISCSGDGYYGLMSNIDVHYYDGELSYITVNNPALLSFQVSSDYQGGVWVLDLDEGEQVIDELSAIAESLDDADNQELVDRLRDVIETISNSGPFTQAST